LRGLGWPHEDNAPNLKKTGSKERREVFTVNGIWHGEKHPSGSFTKREADGEVRC